MSKYRDPAAKWCEDHDSADCIRRDRMPIFDSKPARVAGWAVVALAALWLAGASYTRFVLPRTTSDTTTQGVARFLPQKAGQ